MIKKQIFSLVLLILSLLMMSCGVSHCKEKECKSELYKEGYCKYHYYTNFAEEAADVVSDGIKDIINGE